MNTQPKPRSIAETSADKTVRQPYAPPALKREGDVRTLTQNSAMHMGRLFGMMSPSLPDAPTR